MSEGLPPQVGFSPSSTQPELQFCSKSQEIPSPGKIFSTFYCALLMGKLNVDYLVS